VQEELPIKIVILNNGYLGMVRQWQELFFEKNYSATRIAGPDFAQLAQAYGIPGRTITKKADVTEVLQEAQDAEGPMLIDFHIEQEHNVFPIVPAGKPIDRMLRRPLED
jgi:acetolactate synthase-1/2/3 large subunit